MGLALVTGGAGFIGSAVVDRLVDQGFEVHVVDDLSSGVAENVNPQAQLHCLDIRTSKCEKLVAELNPQVVVHTAAQISVRQSMADPVFDTGVNVLGLVNILNSLRECSVEKIVFLSTGGAIYGDQEEYPASEQHPLQPTSVYGLAKYVGELYLDFWARSFGLPFVGLRLSNVYGPRQNPHGEAGVVAIFLKQLLKGQVPMINGDGEQTRDFVFVDDVARAACMVLRPGVNGVYNIGTGVETSINEVYRILMKAAGSSNGPQYGPAKEGEQLRSVISYSKAQSDFGWQPEVDLESGLVRTFEYFRSQE